MNGKLGPLFRHAAQRMHDSSAARRGFGAAAVAAHVGVAMDEAEADRLPIVVKIPRVRPKAGESYEEYRERVLTALEPVREKADEVGANAEPLILGNGLAGAAEPERAAQLAEREDVEYVELDPRIQVVQMDDVEEDVGVQAFRQNTGLAGDGVRVAVLDSGIDAAQPFLEVTEAVSTCNESVDIPGAHGTHCAGSIASRDTVFPGIAPGVTLINVKVLDSFGFGTPTFITLGVQAALERRADVLSMSLGFNHLPSWSDRGHGWTCPNGRCPRCTAVDNAVDLGATVIVAAGNDHQRAVALRNQGNGATFDVELACPGQARNSICVAAITKRTFVPAAFSSHGPASYGSGKPDLAGPGVNIMSTLPVPRGSNGQPMASPPRSALFGRKSGTSMATPIVAGAAALLIQFLRQQGGTPTPADVRAALLGRALSALGDPLEVVGEGRVDLGVFNPISGPGT